MLTEKPETNLSPVIPLDSPKSNNALVKSVSNSSMKISIVSGEPEVVILEIKEATLVGVVFEVILAKAGAVVADVVVSMAVLLESMGAAAAREAQTAWLK